MTDYDFTLTSKHYKNEFTPQKTIRRSLQYFCLTAPCDESSNDVHNKYIHDNDGSF